MFRYLTAGESHGPCLTAIIEGVPSGLKIDIDAVNEEMAKRQRGYGRGGRMLIEQDKAAILSGVRFGYTLGSPITLSVSNKDWTNWEKRMAPFGDEQGPLVTQPRPGHADLTGVQKYQRHDVRDILERASARETAARVAVGSIARQLAAQCGIHIVSHVTDIGGVTIKNSAGFDEILVRKAKSELSCIEPETEARMKETIRIAKEAGDSLGGIFEVVVKGLMPGLGSYVQWDRRLDTRLAGALMSIPAIKGVEFGIGFDYAALPGSKAHDEIFYQEDKGYYRTTNRAGGIEGGMTNGEEIIVRSVMKPIPTLMKPLASVDINTRQPVSASTERSDVCAVSAAAVVGEAMVAIVLADALLEKFGGDSMEDVLAGIDNYKKRISHRIK